MSELESVPERKKRRRTAVRAAAAALGTVAAIGLAQKVKTRDPEDRALLPALDASRQKIERILADSLTTQQAAGVLLITPAAVIRQIRSRRLYGVQTSAGWRLPKFQFRGTRLVRNIEQVLPRLDANLDILAVVNWFTNREPDLVLRNAAVSPVEWLEAGGDAREVAEIAAFLGSGL